MKNNKNEVQIFGVIMDIQPGTFFQERRKIRKILYWRKAYQRERRFTSGNC